MPAANLIRLFNSVWMLLFLSPLCALAAEDFNDVKGVSFIKGEILTCRASDFVPAEFNGNQYYSRCQLSLKSLKHQYKSFSVLTHYPAVVWGCFTRTELGGVPILNNENGRYSQYNRTVRYDGNCAVVIRVSYQHGGKCYPYIEGETINVFQSNHLTKVNENADGSKTLEFVPCRLNDVQILFEQ
ncbi:MAG: hypothetical protein J6M93_06195 [Succinivibrio sp.]|nr:hypothetical protein [Succinivibrio sp.]